MGAQDSNPTIREYIRKAISKNFASRNKLPSARERPDIRISDQIFGITIFYSSKYPTLPTLVSSY